MRTGICGLAATAGLGLWLVASPTLAQTTPGLSTRPSNTSCLAPARPTGATGVTFQQQFTTQPAFSAPMKILQAPGNANRWYVAEREGLIKYFNVATPATVTTWIDLLDEVNPDGEGGLLGMAFPPTFPTTREVYVSYTRTGSPLTSVLSRLVLDNADNPTTVTEQVLLTVNQPYTNHKGGDIAFGPDGYLYFGLGDGGSGGDPQNHAQNTTDWLGDMLRIDVQGVPFAERYRIPPDNPFAANPRCGPGANGQPCPEIFAWGLRNPFRWSFDRATGSLWAGDVGQGAYEEVSIVERGGNYGWRCREGAHDYDASECSDADALVEPVAEYGRAIGTTITGGFVYRGTALPARVGQYIFGDYSAGWVAALRDDGNGGYVREQLFDANHSMATFGQDQAGDIYYATLNTGRIYKLVPGTGTATDLVPNDLAATGCVNPGNPQQPASSLIPYDINAPFWSDGATKERWMALPNGTTITVDSAGDWSFPSGTVLMKNFRLGAQIIETRLFMRHPDGVWAGYTYEWNGAQTAATRVRGGKTRLVAGQEWIYPSENQCLQCHTSAAGFSLGPETAQLNRDFLYPSTGITANELVTLQHIGMFSAPLPGTPDTLPRLADPANATQPVHARARAYLHTNCAQCHRPGGPTAIDMDLRNATALQTMRACNVVPTNGDLGIANARRIAPADAAHSVVNARAGRRDANGMPPVGSDLVDAQGVTLLTAWVNGLGSCTDTDNDQADDARDNCVRTVNTDQRDSDTDGFGNRCDADLDNSGGTVNFGDLALFRAAFGGTNANADFDGNGTVNFADLAIFRSLFGTAPGN